MIESNTDPLLTEWKGIGGGADEIGDKCAYIYGYYAPDGTNFVLNGNRFQFQEEYSNDFGTVASSAMAPVPCWQIQGLSHSERYRLVPPRRWGRPFRIRAEAI